MNALTVSKPCLTPRGPPLLLFHNTNLLILVFFLLSVHTFFLRALAARAADASPLTPGAKPSPQGPSFSRLWVWISCVAVGRGKKSELSSPKRAESCYMQRTLPPKIELYWVRGWCARRRRLWRGASAERPPRIGLAALDKA
jgi:hypothetical protein